jgi:hypothetical protein
MNPEKILCAEKMFRETRNDHKWRTGKDTKGGGLTYFNVLLGHLFRNTNENYKTRQ